MWYDYEMDGGNVPGYEYDGYAGDEGFTYFDGDELNSDWGIADDPSTLLSVPMQ